MYSGWSYIVCWLRNYKLKGREFWMEVAFEIQGNMQPIYFVPTNDASTSRCVFFTCAKLVFSCS